VVFAEEVVAGVGHRHPTLVGVDGAEGEVLGSRLRLGEHVEERRLADVGNADDADAQIGADAADQRLPLLLLLLGRHSRAVFQEKSD
jgi:hypothetical protein